MSKTAALRPATAHKETTIEGKVALDGQLLKSGTVTFIGEDNKPRPAAISPEGLYKIEKAPPGPARIQVKSHARSPFGKFKGPNPKEDPPEPALEIPVEYNDAMKSGLTCDVKPGPDRKHITSTFENVDVHGSRVVQLTSRVETALTHQFDRFAVRQPRAGGV